MGASICPKSTTIPQLELQTEPKFHCKLQGPPNIFKPTPIITITVTDDNVDKEESPLKQCQLVKPSEPIVTYIAQQSEEIDTKLQKPWIKKNNLNEIVNNVSKIKDQTNLSQSENNSSCERQQQKSILKKKYSNDPLNQSLSQGSQRSIKKVTFDKKQQVSKYKQ